ncbi:hypothetical protein WISP_138440 [Willisornis vidua]|uniref:LIN7A protein n=1 Tax=Willisornis vidua TaxID=1566151 RepID=A0ABQ9CT78_9PASS|nr:hypothetical protein WISP_138440 [Willisornis vidua]
MRLFGGLAQGCGKCEEAIMTATYKFVDDNDVTLQKSGSAYSHRQLLGLVQSSHEEVLGHTAAWELCATWDKPEAAGHIPLLGLPLTDVARAIELLEKLQESGEVPVHKLQSLKKVLQSEFCTAIREVYQYMHETITVNGCPEFRARATAKATVAAFAASEGHSHPRVVELPKTDEGLGFNVMGGKEQNSPIYISRIIPGGVAERHGGLKRGDQLLSVNGVSVEGEHHEKAVELLKAAKDSVKLVVRYTPKVILKKEKVSIKSSVIKQPERYFSIPAKGNNYRNMKQNSSGECTVQD